MSRKKSGFAISLFAFQDAITSVCGVVVLVTLLLALQLTQRVLLETEQKTVAKEQVEQTRERVEKLQEALLELHAQNDDESSDPTALGIGLSLAEVKSRLANARARLKDAQTESERLDDLLVQLAPVEESFEQERLETERLRQEIESTLAEARETTVEQINAQQNAVYSFDDTVKEKPWYVEVSGSKIVAHGSVDGSNDRTFDTAFGFTTWATTRPRSTEYFVLIIRPSGAKNSDFIQEELDDEGYLYGIDLIGENKPLVFLDVNAPSQTAPAGNSGEGKEPPKSVAPPRENEDAPSDAADRETERNAAFAEPTESTSPLESVALQTALNSAAYASCAFEPYEIGSGWSL